MLLTSDMVFMQSFSKEVVVELCRRAKFLVSILHQGDLSKRRHDLVVKYEEKGLSGFASESVP